MRRRLIQSTLAVVLVVIAVFGVSLVIVETRTIGASAQERVDLEALRLASIVDSRILGDEQINAEILEDQVTDQRYARVAIPGRDPIEVGTKPTGEVIQSKEAVGEEGETVVVEEPRSSITREVGRTFLIIGAVALLAVIAAVLLAVRQANRLASPLTDLAETAERLGSGDPRPRHKRYGVPELDRVADVLDSSAERIARMLTAERRLAADASHQLRTPLTALSMRLEEITLTDDPDTVKEEATIALGQVERLTDVVQRLLTNSRDPRTGSAVTFDLDEVINQQLAEWRPAYRSVGRAIVSSGKRHLQAVGTPGAVAQVLAALIENSLMHGGGTVALRTRVTGNQAVVEVTDEGEESPPSSAPGSSSGPSVAKTRPVSASLWPVIWRRRTADGSKCSRRSRRSSACSCPVRRRSGRQRGRSRRRFDSRSAKNARELPGRTVLRQEGLRRQERFGTGHGLAGRERTEHPGAVGPEAEQGRDTDAEELEEVALQGAVEVEAVRGDVQNAVLDHQADGAEQQEEREFLGAAALVAVAVGEIAEAYVVGDDRHHRGDHTGPHDLQIRGAADEVEDEKIDPQPQAADHPELGELPCQPVDTLAYHAARRGMCPA